MACFPMALRLVLGSFLLCCFCMAAVGQQVTTFNYRGGAQGRVTFDHATHASKGYVCMDCHTKFAATGTQLFQTQKQGLISVSDHSGDGKCFACHNGTIAFATCDQCHTN
ncbi:MAG: cytochrome c3 family protein [Xanthobacteraceae bacterium]